VQAYTGCQKACFVYGQAPEGLGYNDNLFMGGGQGASDGSAAVGPDVATSAANTSIELFESRTPALVVRRRIV